MLANLALASFIKFQGSTKTAIAVTVIMGVAGLYFFLSHFRWMRYVTGTRSDPQTRTLKVHTCVPAWPARSTMMRTCPLRRMHW